MMPYKNAKRGFTLVELIVVLVILAILAAMLVPVLTGYIDKSNQSAVIAETRSLLQAVQTEAVEMYGSGNLKGEVGSAGKLGILTLAAEDGASVGAGTIAGTADDLKTRYNDIASLSEVPSISNKEGKFFALTDFNGRVQLVLYDDGKGYIGLYMFETKEYLAFKKSEGYSLNAYSSYIGKIVAYPFENQRDETDYGVWAKQYVIATLQYKG